MKLIFESNPEQRLSAAETKARVGAGFAYHESSQPFYRLKILLKNLEQEPELYLNKKSDAIYHLRALIDFIGKLERANQGIANLHSGAVVNNRGEGLLFSAWQDVGKTTLALLLSSQGYGLIGDDGIALASSGEITRQQTRTGVFPHPDNLKLLKLPFTEKLKGWFKYRFIKYAFLGKFINSNLWADYEWFPKISDRAMLDRVYILELGKKNIAELDAHTAANKILTTVLAQILPDGFAKRFILSYCFANNLPPTLIQDKYRAIITSALSGKKIYKISGQNYLEIYHQFLENENKLAQ